MGLVANMVCLAAGLYAGMYLDQNFELPRLLSAQEVGNKIQAYFQSIEKNKPRTS